MANSTDHDLEPDREHDRHEKHDHEKHKDEPGRAMVALFQSGEEGREAIKALRKAHYGPLWFGTTSIAETNAGDAAVTVETGGFFSKTQSLVDALVQHGVDGNEARELCEEIEPGNSVVTVEPRDKPVVEAIEIVEKYGGRLSPVGSMGSGSLSPSRATLLLETSPLDYDALDGQEEIFYRR